MANLYTFLKNSFDADCLIRANQGQQELRDLVDRLVTLEMMVRWEILDRLELLEELWANCPHTKFYQFDKINTLNSTILHKVHLANFRAWMFVWIKCVQSMCMKTNVRGGGGGGVQDTHVHVSPTSPLLQGHPLIYWAQASPPYLHTLVDK